MTSGRRRARWLLAGGVVGGVALAPRVRRGMLEMRARATRVSRVGDDPVAPFCEAPCYEHDRAAAGGPPRTEAAR
jgi:hypothetical protein